MLIVRRPKLYYTVHGIIKRIRGSNPGGDEVFRTCPNRPWGQPSLLYNGYRVFPGVKSGRGVTLTPHPLLVPWSRKSRAIPLLPLWAVRPVQSLSACTRVHFTFLLYNRRWMQFPSDSIKPKPLECCRIEVCEPKWISIVIYYYSIQYNSNNPFYNFQSFHLLIVGVEG